MCFQIKELKIHENTYFRLESEKKNYLSISDKLFIEKVSILSTPTPPPPHPRIMQRTKDRKLSAKARPIRFLVVRHIQY